MILNIIAGETGTGKTQLVRDLIKKYPNVCVYDRQGHDYPELPIFNPYIKQRKFRMVGRESIEKIKKLADPEKGIRGFVFVIEEATGIFKNQSGLEWIDIALSKRHRLNRFFFIFHSLHRVPPDLMEYADYIYLFKTGDYEKNIRSKFPTIHEDFVRLSEGKEVESEMKNFRGKEVVTKIFVPLRKTEAGATISEHIIYKKTDLAKQDYV